MDEIIKQNIKQEQKVTIKEMKNYYLTVFADNKINNSEFDKLVLKKLDEVLENGNGN